MTGLQRIGGILNGGSLVTTYEDQPLSDSVLAAVEALRPGLLRFPAGTFANYYDWKTGTYQVAGTPDVASPRRRLRSFPIDSLFSLARRWGARVSYVVNVYQDPPEKTAELARYIKDHGYRVAFWELGNEAASPRLSDKFRSVQDYLDVARAHARAIHEVFPHARVGVTTQNRSFAIASWNRRLATQGSFDDIVVHRYLGPNRGERQRLKGRDATISVADALPDLLRHSSPGVVTRTYDDLFSGKRYWVSEWGLLYMHTNVEDSMAHAVWMGRTFIAFLRDPSVQMAAYWNFNASPFELVDEVEGHLVRRLPYYVFQMISRRLATARQTAAVRLQTTDGDAAGLVGQLLVDSAGHRALIVVNSSGRPQRVEVSQDLTPQSGSEPRVDLIGSNAADASNGYSLASSQALRTQTKESVVPQETSLDRGTLDLPGYAVAVVDWGIWTGTGG